MSGGPSQLDLFDPKPLLNQMNGQDLPGVGPDGPAADRDVGPPGDVPVGRLDLQVRPARRIGHWLSELLPAHGQGRRRALLRQVALHRSDQPRPGDHLLPDRLPARGPAEHGGLAQLRARDRPTRTSPRSWCSSPRTGSTSPSMPGSGATGSCPRIHQGVQFRSGSDPVLFLDEPRRRLAGEPPEDARPARRARTARVRRHRRPGDQRPGRPVRDGVPDADERSRR